MNGRNKKTPVLVFLGVLCLVLAGCSGGGGQTDATTHGTEPSVYMDTGVEVQEDIPDISIESSGFSPQTFTVEYLATGGSGGYKGGCNPCPQVIWVNNDDKPHTITSDTGDFDSGPIGPGEQWTWTFIQAGTYDYHCTYHEEMTGTVEVVAVEKKSS